MNIRYCKSRWEYGQVPFTTYLDRLAADGFDGAEVFLFPLSDSPAEIRSGVKDRGLFLIGQVISLGDSPGEHRDSLTAQIEKATACGATFVNSHTGSDFFSFEENLALFRHVDDLSRKHGVPVRHETHRGRALYNLPDTLRYLDALPGLELTVDLSHFMCVHESELRNRTAQLGRVIVRTRHIHARVGFPEGPQVGHPLAPEWSDLLEFYLELWIKMARTVVDSGAPFVTITPEAGPPGYMPVLPFSNMPVADAWTVNVQMKNWLKTRMG